VGLQAESRRFYPKKTLAGPVLGFTGMDHEGLEGIERAYDKVLRGVSGWLLAEKDAVGRTVFPGGPGLQYKLPKAGNDIILTIDEVIQHIAEKELDAMLATARAKGGFCIVMNPGTGEVLALAVRTGGRGRRTFNPNEPQHYRPEEWRNRCVTTRSSRVMIFKSSCRGGNGRKSRTRLNGSTAAQVRSVSRTV
jgi:cell division protein FtsI/penicillin-binding protein 2